MMKHEFESRIGAEVSPEEYKIIEHVYTWHPSIPNVGGKDVLAQLYKLGGMIVIMDMDGSASAAESIYEDICEKLRKTVTRKGQVLDQIAETQKRLDALNAEFDNLTRETEALQMRKEVFDRGDRGI